MQNAKNKTLAFIVILMFATRILMISIPLAKAKITLTMGGNAAGTYFIGTRIGLNSPTVISWYPSPNIFQHKPRLHTIHHRTKLVSYIRRRRRTRCPDMG